MSSNRPLPNFYRFFPLFDFFKGMGYFSLICIILFSMRDCDSACTSIISRSPSPDGHVSAVVLDCWPQVGLGGQTPDQKLIVHLVSPAEEQALSSTLEPCHYSEAAILSIWKEDSRDRPLLHWLSSNHLEVSIPDGSRVTLYKTNYKGIVIDWTFEKIDGQNKQRRDETSGESSNIIYSKKYNEWFCQ